MSERPEEEKSADAPPPAPAPDPAADPAPVPVAGPPHPDPPPASRGEGVQPPAPDPGPVPRVEEDPEKAEPTKQEPAPPSALVKLDFPLTLVALVAGVLLLLGIQFSTDQLIDHDSLYHVEAANLLAHNENLILKREFPWMQATFLLKHYADKEFLFHALLIPFCDTVTTMDEGGKKATVVFGAFVLIAFVLAVRAAGIRHGWLWLLLFLGAGYIPLFRLTETRPHLLSVGLVLLGVRFVLRREALPLYFIGFLLAWSYSGPQVLPAFAIVAAIAVAAREEKIVWKPSAAALVGVASGLVLNPFVPNNLRLWYVQNVEVLLRAWGIHTSMARIGEELTPFTTRALLLQAPGLAFAAMAALVTLVLARKRPSSRTAQLAALAIAASFALALSAKFLDYASPLIVLFAGAAIDDQWRALAPPATERRRLWRLGLQGAFAVAVLALAILSGVSCREFVKRKFSSDPPLRGCARWLRANAVGMTVVHFDWNDFSTLFHDNPMSFYLFGLDPTFAEVTEPKLVKYLEEIRAQKLDVKPRWFREYGLETKPAFLVVKQGTYEAGACLASNLDNKYEDDGGIVFSLGD